MAVTVMETESKGTQKEGRQKLTAEIAYPLLKEAANYYKKQSTYYAVFLSHTVDDIVQDSILQMLKYGYFDKYDSNIRSARGAAYGIVANVLKDKFKTRLTKHVVGGGSVSLDKVMNCNRDRTDQDITLGDMVQSNVSVEREVIYGLDSLLEEYSTEELGIHIVYNDETKALSVRCVVELLLEGHTYRNIKGMLLEKKRESARNLLKTLLEQVEQETLDIVSTIW